MIWLAIIPLAYLAIVFVLAYRAPYLNEHGEVELTDTDQHRRERATNTAPPVTTPLLRQPHTNKRS